MRKVLTQGYFSKKQKRRRYKPSPFLSKNNEPINTSLARNRRLLLVA